MSVSIIQPSDGNLAEVVRVASDAPTNYQAIAEIEEWASQNGYGRSNENWLQVIASDGGRRFVGTCYRMLEADRQAVEERIKARSELRTRMA